MGDDCERAGKLLDNYKSGYIDGMKAMQKSQDQTIADLRAQLKQAEEERDSYKSIKEAEKQILLEEVKKSKELSQELDDAVELLKALGQQQMDDFKRHKAEMEERVRDINHLWQRDSVWRAKKEMLENDLAKAFDCLKRISDRCLFNHKCDDCGIVFCVFRIAREGLRGANPGEIRDVVKQLALYRKAVGPVVKAERFTKTDESWAAKMCKCCDAVRACIRVLGEADLNDSPKVTEGVTDKE